MRISTSHMSQDFWHVSFVRRPDNIQLIVWKNMKQMLFLAKVLRILHVLYHGKKVECSQVVTTNIYLKA